MAKVAKCSPRQKEFCKQYVIDSVGSKAAIRSGYSPRTAHVTACKLLKLPHIKKEIAKLREKMAEKMEITKDEILARLNKRSKLVEEMADLAIKDSLTDIEKDKLARLRDLIKTSDANRADEMLARMLGYNEPEEVNVKHDTIIFQTIDPTKSRNEEV